MVQYTLTRQRRKTICLMVGEDLMVQVKAPSHMPQAQIDDFVAKHQSWIEKQRARVDTRNQARQQQPYTEDDIQTLKQQAKEAIPPRVAVFSQQMGLFPIQIKITAAAQRWGSCSSKNSLCFSYRLMLLPQPLVDYVIVHELAHIAEKNHGPRFYAIVAQQMPDYKARVSALRERQYHLPI